MQYIGFLRKPELIYKSNQLKLKQKRIRLYYQVPQNNNREHMNKKLKIILGAASVCAVAGAVAAQPQNPNILIICTDDQGIGQLKFKPGGFKASMLAEKFTTERYKCDPAKAAAAAEKAMPNIAKLANQGVVFTNAFVASPVCAPSRAAIMTARYPARYGVYDNPDMWNGLSTSEKLLPQLFRQDGYRTAMIGKWHLGKSNVTKIKTDSRDYHRQAIHECAVNQHPLKRGFEHYLGFNSSGSSYYDPPDIFRDFKHVKAPGYTTEIFTDDVLNFINTSDDKPFFVFLAYNAPHIPLERMAPEKYQKFNTGNKEADNYYATIYAVDCGIGKIINQLEKSGRLQNTIIFFVSDNGAVIDSPQPRNGEFKGFKGMTFQGGVHVPMIAFWPGKIKAGQIYSQNVSAMDILPTCMDAAEIPTPNNLDGKSLLSYLDGRDSGQPHQYLFWAGPRNLHWSIANAPFWHSYNAWIRFKTDKKPNSNKTPGFAHWNVLHEQWMLHYYAKDKSFSLYDLSTDPGETHNLAAKHPEVVEKLKNAGVEWLKTLPAPVHWAKSTWETLMPEAD